MDSKLRENVTVGYNFDRCPCKITPSLTTKKCLHKRISVRHAEMRTKQQKQ